MPGAARRIQGGPTLAVSSQWFRVYLEERSAKVWICTSETKWLDTFWFGRATPENVFCHQRQWHEVDQISVHPKFQGRGIARALLRRVTDSAAAAGVHEVELNTWYFNQHAQSAFVKLGFSVKNVRFSRR